MNEIEINGECNKVTPTIFKAIICLKSMGYEILTISKNTANGPDLHIKKDEMIFRVEVKKCRSQNRSMAVHPVEDLRKNDDLICIVFPSGYVLIEPMNHHLKNCAPSGSRSFFGVY